MTDQRLDAALAARGLARSRTHAATLIAAGVVTVDGRPVVKASAKVGDDAVLEVAASDHYVSRAAHKLIAGLDGFGVDRTGRLALDAGASTGGFSQVLLERGARQVLAVDVGPRPARARTRRGARARARRGVQRAPPRCRECSRSHRGRRAALARRRRPLVHLAHRGASCAARERDRSTRTSCCSSSRSSRSAAGECARASCATPALRAEAVANVLWAAFDLGLGTAGVLSSPIAGGHGNLEYLVHLSAAQRRRIRQNGDVSSTK